MANQKNHPEKFTTPSSYKSTKKERGKHTGIAGFLKRFQGFNTLYLLAGIFQMVTGVAVVVISVLGLIHPVWLSAVLSIVSSIGTITGMYLCYSVVSEFNKDTLLRDAMRRIVEDQN